MADMGGARCGDLEGDTMSKKHRFAVTVSKTIIVEFNASIMPDDDWRKHFYGSIRTPQNLAEHLGFNYVANGTEKLSQLDGFADKKDSMATFKDDMEWDVESYEKK